MKGTSSMTPACTAGGASLLPVSKPISVCFFLVESSSHKHSLWVPLPWPSSHSLFNLLCPKRFWLHGCLENIFSLWKHLPMHPRKADCSSVPFLMVILMSVYTSICLHRYTTVPAFPSCEKSCGLSGHHCSSWAQRTDICSVDGSYF